MHGKDLPDSLTSEQKDKFDKFKGPVIINQHTGEIMGDRTFTDFRRKAKEVVSRAKGNMSNADTALYKTYAVGRLLMQYRGWIPSTVLERVKSEQYNQDTYYFTEDGNCIYTNRKKFNDYFCK